MFACVGAGLRGPGYRDEISNLCNALFVEKSGGGYSLTLDAPMLREVRKRVNSGWHNSGSNGTLYVHPV
jgi:hypothetical protein